MENKFTTIKERVVQIAENQNITKESFFASIGMTSANFRGKAKETPLNSKTIVNIITKYPEVNLHWLLLGEPKRPVTYGTPSIVREPSVSYSNSNETCKEKDRMIQVLKSQIEDLKSDKEDLKNYWDWLKENDNFLSANAITQKPYQFKTISF